MLGIKGRRPMEKINTKEAIFLIITFCINMSILIAGQVIFEQCGSASLINVFVISIFAIIFACIICKLYKNFAGLNILDIAEFLGGKFLKIIIGIMFFIYFLYTISILLYKLAKCVQIVYFPETNIVYIVFLFIIATGIMCSMKNNAISKVNFIIVPISLITLILIFIGNAKNFEYQNIYPILGNGIDSVFISGIFNIFAFGGMVYLYFLPSKLKEPKNFFKISFWGIVISAIFLLIIVSIIIFMFETDVIHEDLFPLYLAVRYIEFGTFFQRLDSAYLLIRIISFLCFIGISCKLCLDILKSITNVEDSRPINYTLMLIIFGFVILTDKYDNIKILQNNIFKIMFIIGVVIGLVILVCANIKKKIKRN